MGITEQLERIKEAMCDKYCKYCHQEPPEGEDQDWLWNCEDSPCNTCPLNEL